jgi:hypothetical protein
VLLLAAHLKGDRRNYADVPELAFRREGAISAEIDLFAYASRELVAGEVTTNETFGDGKQTVRSLFRKKAAVVEAIGVSKLIFATTQRQFAQGQVSELAAAARSSDLEVSLITGLGGGIVLDAVLERAW